MRKIFRPAAAAALSAALTAGVVAVLPGIAEAATRYEAEVAPATCDGTIDSDWPGYSGSGFCNGDNATGAAAQFTVSASAPGAATVVVRFANGASSSRPADVVMNGSTAQNVSFESTGAWSTWASKVLTVTMPSGNSTIRFSATTSAGLPNIDYIDLTVDGLPPLPNSFQWSSSGVLIAPKSDATHNIRAVKDPSVVYHDGRYHVFVTTTSDSGAYGMAYLNFTDWSQAGAAQHYYLDQTPVGGGYKAAPHVFYFAPQGRWYLVFQTGDNAAYSTTTNIGNPQSWSAPQQFYPDGMPQIIRDNIGNGYWVDFWVICDSAMCYLFSSDDNGHLYQSETTVANFPDGFTNTVIAMQDADRYPLWEAANVYRLDGSDTYLLLVEAIGSGGTRYFRSWTAPAITGPWSPLADTEANPFARSNNVTFDGTAWTQDISHGEMIRSGIDQTMTISPCDLRYVYQGKDPNASDPYNLLPWRLGLLTQTNSACSPGGPTATINGATTYQSIDGFGFSEHFGRGNIMRGSQGLSPAKQREVLDLLLSPDTGAGLSILRLGIASGPGSIQPTDPGGPNAPPNYIWDGDDDGQVWLAQQAKAYGVSRFYADAWSAPGYMKTNGSEANGGTLCGLPGTSCASGDWRAAYADYLVQYAEFYGQEGIPITDLGFTNEPDLTTSYASMRFTPEQAVDYIKAFGPVARAAGLNVTCCETVGWNGQRNYTNAIEADSTARELVDIHTGHAYSSQPTSPLSTSKSTWMTEWAPDGDTWNENWDDGRGYDGFNVADSIHTSLTAGNVNAYVYWYGASTSYTRGFIQLDGDNYRVSKRLWAMANYSRFIRPGANRIAASSPDSNVRLSAFRNSDGSVVVAALNAASGPSEMTFSLQNTGISGGTSRPYLTNGANSTAAQPAIAVANGAFTATVPARSLVTYVVTGGVSPSPTASPSASASPSPSPSTEPFTVAHRRAGLVPGQLHDQSLGHRADRGHLHYQYRQLHHQRLGAGVHPAQRADDHQRLERHLLAEQRDGDRQRPRLQRDNQPGRLSGDWVPSHPYRRHRQAGYVHPQQCQLHNRLNPHSAVNHETPFQTNSGRAFSQVCPVVAPPVHRLREIFTKLFAR